MISQVIIRDTRDFLFPDRYGELAVELAFASAARIMHSLRRAILVRLLMESCGAFFEIRIFVLKRRANVTGIQGL